MRDAASRPLKPSFHSQQVSVPTNDLPKTTPYREKLHQPGGWRSGRGFSVISAATLLQQDRSNLLTVHDWQATCSVFSLTASSSPASRKQGAASNRARSGPWDARAAFSKQG